MSKSVKTYIEGTETRS